MKQISSLRTSFLLSFLFLLFQGLPSQAAEPPHETGILVFKLKPELRNKAGNQFIELPRLAQALHFIGATQTRRKFPLHTAPAKENPEHVDLSLIYEVQFSKPITPAVAADILRKTKCVTYAEPLRFYPALHEPNDPLADSSSGPSHHLRKIHAYEAWDIERGDSTVKIAILDTGVMPDHEDLHDKIAHNYADPIDGIDNDQNGYVDDFKGWDFADNDNDPTMAPTGGGHGSAVASVAAAHTNNGLGVAGVGYHCQFVPIKIYPSTNFSGHFGGFEAIVYAADQGYPVINLSWGAAGSPSAYEQDIVNYAALNKNVVIVSAAGNTNDYLDFFPASYAHVLSVASTDSFGVKAANHTFSYFADICAPGTAIRSVKTTSTSSYGGSGGSSFACAQVSGAAALVRAHWPQLSAEQVAEQVRITADPSIYTLPGNLNYQEQLGRGWLNVFSALKDTLAPSIRCVSRNLDDQRALLSGDTVVLSGVFKNFLRPAQNLVVSISSPSPYLQLLDSTVSLGSLGTLQSADNTSNPFRFIVLPGAPVNDTLLFRMEFQANGYSDYQYFYLFANPDYVNLTAGDLDVTLSSTANLGYAGTNRFMGLGVRYKGGQSLLTEGGLMIAADTGRVSSSVRSLPGETSQHFYAQQPMHYIPSVLADQVAEGMLVDSFPLPYTVGLEVKQTGYAWQQTPNREFVVVTYDITNVSGAALPDAYAGLFADWDLYTYSHNKALLDTAYRLGYVQSNDTSLFAGLVLLTPQPLQYYALDNYGVSGNVFMYDQRGFSQPEKFETLSSGTAISSSGTTGQGSDVCHVLGADLGGLLPNETKQVAFAITAANSLAGLQQNAATALSQFQHLGTVKPVSSELNMYPNPVSNVLFVKTGTASGELSRLNFYNQTGQLVKQVALPAGSESFSVPVADLPVGLYLVSCQQKGRNFTSKMVISR